VMWFVFSLVMWYPQAYFLVAVELITPRKT
jgi:hypothetical protein